MAGVQGQWHTASSSSMLHRKLPADRNQALVVLSVPPHPPGGRAHPDVPSGGDAAGVTGPPAAPLRQDAPWRRHRLADIRGRLAVWSLRHRWLSRGSKTKVFEIQGDASAKRRRLGADSPRGDVNCRQRRMETEREWRERQGRLALGSR